VVGFVLLIACLFGGAVVWSVIHDGPPGRPFLQH
jgi:hypothetical protein